MYEFFGELENEEKQDYFKVFPVMAKDAKHAHEILSQMISENKTGVYTFIYQISRKFDWAELPQPVFDFMNGFEIYENR